MARTKEAARKNVHDRSVSSSSSTSQYFLTPPSATTPNNSGNQNSSEASDKNFEVQSTPTISITEMVTNLIHASNPQTVQTSQMLIGSVPINIPTIVAEK
ncbi:hypothetical protein P8452_64977 [Trifolium repens]|jgi:hypothetical protein|nr:hypothetical protein QL285_086348 [Trifolium repens]WJX82190.1 hypothetical protein P8452_64977 [Trifolium repens]